jgi:pimeloyl-ACP methyl ester carboxylesterase
MNPFYFGSITQSLFGIYHPPSAAITDTAVLLCPPLGQEYMRSHWAMRRLADQLAKCGCHVLRFDYFGTGDSSGELIDAKIEYWCENIQAAASELYELSGIPRVSIVGLRAGAMLAAITAALNTNTLVLWDPVINGIDYLQELRLVEKEKLININAIHKVPVQQQPDELLGYAFPVSLQDSIKSVDLQHDFRHKSDKVYVFSTGDKSQLSGLEAQLKNQADNCKVEYVDDAGDWGDASQVGHAFLPNTIILNIVRALTER